MRETIIICNSCGKKISNMQEDWQEQYMELRICNHVGSILHMHEFCSLKCLFASQILNMTEAASDNGTNNGTIREVTET